MDTAPVPRLRQLCLAVPSLQPLQGLLQRLFGLGEAYHDPHVAHWGLANAVLGVGRQFIELVAPLSADAPVQRFLARRPDGGGYLVMLTDPAIDARRAHLQALGARLITDGNLGVAGFHTLQVHPRDAGACMLEFDHTEGGESWDGPYLPAGPDWHRRPRSRSVAGLAGVTLQSPEPQALRSRWAALCGVAPDGQGRLALDGGWIAFEAGPECLAALTLQVHDLPSLLQRAHQLGLSPAEPDHPSQLPQLQLAGLSWRLQAMAPSAAEPVRSGQPP